MIRFSHELVCKASYFLTLNNVLTLVFLVLNESQQRFPGSKDFFVLYTSFLTSDSLILYKVWFLGNPLSVCSRRRFIYGSNLRNLSDIFQKWYFFVLSAAYSSYDEVLEKVASGEVDAAIINKEVASYMQNADNHFYGNKLIIVKNVSRLYLVS